MMKCSCFLTPACIFLLSLVSFSRTTSEISGTVIDIAAGKPVTGASIVVVGTSLGAVTGDDGVFRLSGLKEKEYTVEITCIGYLKVSKHLALADNEERHLTIFLKPTVVPIENVNVTASRFAAETFSSPLSVTITPSQEFAERTFSTTAEVLREEPGILVQKTTCGHGAPVLRGLIGKYVLLLYDGIRLNRSTFRFGANQYLNTIDLESLNRIEVVRGPSSVMYGSDAIGGTINLIPPSPPSGNDHLSLTPRFVTRYSSADNGSSSNCNLAGDFKQISGLVGISYKHIGDLRAGGEIGRQRPTGWEETNAYARLFYWLNDSNSLNFDYMGIRQDEIPRYDKYVSGQYEQYIYDPQDRDLFGLTFTSHDFNSIVRSLKANVSFCRELEGRTEQKTGSPKISYYEDKLSTWGGYFQLSSVPYSGHQLNTGCEYYHDNIRGKAGQIQDGITEAIRPTYPDNSNYSSVGIFMQDNWHIRDGLKAAAGVRYSFCSVDTPLEESYGEFKESYDDVTAALSLSYSLTPWVNLIARWSRGFRTPNLNDVAVLKTSSSGVDVPSPGLTPEHSDNFEFGVKIRSSPVTGSVFVYYNQLKDLIDRVPGTYDGLTFFDENGNGIQDEDEFSVYRRENVAKARIYGIEYESTVRINRTLTARLNWFWTRGENQTDNEPLSRIPPLMGMAAVRVFPRDNLWLEIFVRAADDQRRLSRRDIDDTRIDPGGTDGWMTLNFRTRFEFGRQFIIASLENITDREYKEHGSGICSPGRNVMISLGYGF
ncbi:MAG: TonB-dependent receptor [Candidatus Zixiibacteriota bacterium]|nr:MAG: TonB-dependent receptor [candidate division Zixibacteria bacterium]